MKKCFLIILIMMITVSFFAPVNVVALGVNSEKHVLANKQKSNTTTSNQQANNSGVTADEFDKDQNCNTLLGNPSDENSVAWLIQKLLNFVQIIGPLLVVILSSIDFAQVIIKSDDEAMAKATKKLTTRLILAAVLFLLPSLVTFLLNIFNLTSDPTCGLH